jgi:hypothetical protein
VPSSLAQGHLIFDTYDLATQQCTRITTLRPDGTTRYGSGSFRYIWPAECDSWRSLPGSTWRRASLTGMAAPFTSDSENHVSVWRKPS